MNAPRHTLSCITRKLRCIVVASSRVTHIFLIANDGRQLIMRDSTE